MMTIGDHPDYLAVGYLLNQNMLRPDDEITGIDHDAELELVVVRTKRRTDYEDKLKKKVRTSGCAQGTVFGDLMERLRRRSAAGDAVLRTTWLYALTQQDQHPAVALPQGRRHPRLRALRGRPAAALHGGCRPAQRGRQDRRLHVPARDRAGRQDLLHDRPADLGNGDQDRADAHPDPDLALGLHCLGRGAGAPSGAHADRTGQGTRFLALAGATRIVFDADPRESPRRTAGTAAKVPTMATEVVGALLAGGLARRMGGGDKALARVAGGRSFRM